MGHGTPSADAVGSSSLVGGPMRSTNTRGVWIAAIAALAVGGCSQPEEGVDTGSLLQATTNYPASEDYVAYATNSLVVGDSAGLHGHVGVHDSGGLGPMGALADGVRASIGAWANVGGSSAKYFLADTVVIRYGTYFWVAHIGSAVLDQHAAGYVVNGAYPSGSMPNVPRSRPSMPGMAPLTVTQGSTTTLSGGGAYSTLELEAGAVLELQAGTYQVGSVVMGASARLRATGSVLLLVADGLQALPGSHLEVAPGLSASDLRIEVFGGNGGAGGPLDLPYSVDVGDSSVVQALIIASQGTLSLGAGTNAVGAFAARDIDIGANAVLNYEDGITPLSGSAPLAYADAFSGSEDVPLVVPAEGVLGNDVDPNYLALTATVATPPGHGSVVLAQDGSFVYTPNANYAGPDTFTYTASNGTSVSSTTAVSIVIDAVNDIPNIVSHPSTDGFVGQLWSYETLVNDPDDGDTHTYSLINAPSGVAVSASGLVTWMPSQTQVGLQSFTLVVSDGDGAQDQQPVSVTIASTPASNGFVAYASESLFFDVDAVSVDGKVGVQGVGVGGPYVGGASRAVMTYWAIAGKVAGADLFGDSVELRIKSQAQDVYTNNLAVDDGQSRGQVAGLPLMPSLPTVAAVTPGVTPLNHSGAGAELTITATQAGAVTVGPGARLLLEAGLYEFASVDIADGGALAALGPVEIRIAGRLDLGADAYIGPAEDAALGTNEVRVDVHAGQPVAGDPLSTPTAVLTSTASSIAATLVAPNGTVVLGNMSVNWGFFGGRDLVAKQAAIFFLGEHPVANRPPVIVSHPSLSAISGQAYTYAVDAYDPGDTVTFTVDTGPTGLAIDSASGVVTWAPTSADVGPNSVLLRATDSSGAYDVQTFSIDVTTGTNSSPSFVTTAPSTVAAGLVYLYPSQAVDPDQEPLTYSLFSGPAGMQIDPTTGEVTWSPDVAAEGLLHWATIRATDAGQLYAQQTFSILVVPPNHAPIALADSAAVLEQQVLIAEGPIGVLYNDTDPEGEWLEADLLRPPLNGSVSLWPNGEYQYLANAAFVGVDTFTYEARDPWGATATATVTIHVNGPGSPPVAVDDPSYILFGQPWLDVDTSLGVLTNDTDADNDPLIAVVHTYPTYGRLELDPDGAFRYFPQPGQPLGTITFEYRAFDGANWSAPATASIYTLAPISQSFANDDAYATPEDTTLTVVAGSGVMANDEIYISYLTPNVQLVSDTTNGTLTLNSDGGFGYTPDPNFVGSDSFSYEILGVGTPGPYAVVTIDVGSLNDPPVPIDDYYRPVGGIVSTSSTTGLLVNDYDNDGDSFTAVLSQAPVLGTVALAPDGGFTYTASVGLTGKDYFTYRLTDGVDLSPNSAVVTIVLTSTLATGPPEIVSSPVRDVKAGNAYAYQVEVEDPDLGETFTYTLTATPTALGIDAATGLISWSTTGGDVGVYDVGVTVTDSQGLTDTQPYRIHVLQNALTGPVIVPPGDTVVNAGEEWSYTPEVIGVDYSDRVFFAVQVPAGADFNAQTGETRYRWSNLNAGLNPIDIRLNVGGTEVSSVQFSVDVVAGVGIVSSPPTPANDGQLYQYQAVAVDRGDTNLTWATFGDTEAGVSISATTGLLTWNVPQQSRPLSIAEESQVATSAQFALSVADTAGIFGSQVYEVPRLHDQYPPYFASLPSSPQVTVGQQFSYLAHARDWNQDPITYSIIGGAPEMGITPVGQFIWAPTLADVGSRLVVIRASDGTQHTDQSFTINVFPSTTAPQITSTPPSGAEEGTLFSYPLTAIDAENDPITYTLIGAPTGMALTGGNVIEWTPAPEQVGTVGFTVEARDTTGRSDQQNVYVTVRQVPDAPQILGTPLMTVNQGQSYSWAFAVLDPDYGDQHVLELITAPATMTVNQDQRVLSWSPGSSDVGVHRVVLRVVDLSGLQDVISFDLTVATAEYPPVVYGLTDSVAYVGQAFSSFVDASDPDGTPLSFVLLLGGPAGLTLHGSSGELRWTPTVADVGLHTFDVEVSDSAGSITATVEIEVRLNSAADAGVGDAGNQAPLFLSAPMTSAVMGTPWAYNFVVVDDGPGAVQYSLVDGPYWMQLVAGNTPFLTWSPTLADEGAWPVVIAATDGLGQTTTQTFNVIARRSEAGASAVPSLAYCSSVANPDPHWAQLEMEMVALINQRRAFGYDCGSTGVFGPTQPVTVDPSLRCAARIHAQDMALRGYFAHVTPEGITPNDRAASAGYTTFDAYENAGHGPVTLSVEQMMQAFLDSPGHCANIMNPSHHALGVGHDPNGQTLGQLYVQVFGAGTDQNLPPIIRGELTELVAGVESTQHLRVFDPEGYPVQVGAIAPAGFSISRGGTVRWTPTLQDIGVHEVTVVAADILGAVTQVRWSVEVLPQVIPPDPSLVATPIDSKVFESFRDQVAFLWTEGPNRSQWGFQEAAVPTEAIAVIRGTVRERGGAPLSGVAIAVPGQPEVGTTITRVDGSFDIAVKGGAPVILRYQRGGYVASERAVNPSWGDFSQAPDVALVPLAPAAAVTVGAGSPAQVAQGPLQSDSDGSRQATLAFPAGTGAEAVLPNGSRQPLTSLSLRATELTVGPDGRAAMPAELPPGTAYTYAVDIRVDEAHALGADHVVFTQPVPLYVENFLGFPVGTIVPVGYYESSIGAWVGADNGRVIEVLSITGGAADLDISGSGVAAGTAELFTEGITTAERQQIATLYGPGATLWRAPLSHLSTVDLNWQSQCAGGNCQPPNVGPAVADEKDEDPCKKDGSIIECQSQVLGETVGIVGTGLAASYRSDRVPGRTSRFTLEIPVTGATVPGNVTAVEMVVDVAGQTFRQTFSAAPNQVHTFTWDGRDAYGRLANGPRKARARVAHRFAANYTVPAGSTRSFGLPGQSGTGTSFEINPARQDVALWKTVYDGMLGGYDARAFDMGGWTLSAHHRLDPSSGVVSFGDGTQQSIGGTAGSLSSLLPPDYSINDMAVAANGDLILSTIDQIWRWSPRTGVIRHIAGAGGPGFSGDGGPAQTALFDGVGGVAIDRLDNIYVADTQNNRIRKIGSDGIIRTIAGDGTAGFDGYTGVAFRSKFNDPVDVAVDSAGVIYVSDRGNHMIRKIYPDQNAPGGYGLVITVVGNNTPTMPVISDGLPGISSRLHNVKEMALSADDTLYFVANGRNIWRLEGDYVHNVFDCSSTPLSYSSLEVIGGSPTTCRHRSVYGDSDYIRIAIDRAGVLYLADLLLDTVLRIGRDGVAQHAAGLGLPSWAPGRAIFGPPLEFAGGLTSVGLGQDGTVYLGSYDGLFQMLGTTQAQATDVPSRDGGKMYRFDPQGRHLETVDTVTGITEVSFGYDVAGRLVTITDKEGDQTTIERGAQGLAIALVGPDQLRTTLGYDANNYLASITNPAGEAWQFGYDSGGLLTLTTDPNGNTSPKRYYPDGRLEEDEDAAGAVQRITRTMVGGVEVVEHTSGEGYKTRYETEVLPDGTLVKTTIGPDGLASTHSTLPDGTMEAVSANGIVTTTTLEPDPRFGMLAPRVASSTVTYPSGRSISTQHKETYILSDPSDPVSVTNKSSRIVVNGQERSHNTYDVATRTAIATTAVGRQSTNIYDANDRLVEQRSPGILPIFYSYDGRGRLTRVDQGTRSTSSTYDSRGFNDTTTDALQRTSYSVLDAVGRTTELTTPDLRKTTFRYDTNGNNTSLTPPGAASHGFTFTSRNLPEYYVPPSTGLPEERTRTEYNLDRAPTIITLPDGSQVSMAYDPVTRRAQSVVTPEGAITFGYDPNYGNVTSITSPDVTLSYTYDGPLPLSTTYAGAVQGSITRSFDANLQVSGVSISGTATIAFAHDLDGVVTQAGPLTVVSRPDNALLHSTTAGVGASSYSHDGYGDFGGMSYQAGATAYSTMVLRDALGRITQNTETIGGVTSVYTYIYNASDQLEEVLINGVRSEFYTYDANDSRMGAETPVYTTTVAVADAQDRLTSYGAYDYLYSAHGTLSSKTLRSTGETTTYGYDSRGNLLQVDLPGAGPVIDYVVDGVNRRVAKVVDGTLERGFLWDGSSIVAELDAQGALLSRFIYATKSHVPDLMLRGGKVYRLVTDNRGSVRLVVDTSSGVVAQRIDYDSFGQVLSDSSPGFTPFAYSGGLYDPDTGLVRFGVRDYDSYSGRWTARDPSGFQETGNLYAYVGNDPVNLIDPTGRIAIVGAILGFGVDVLLDVAEQLIANGFNVDCIDIASALQAGAVGAVAGAVGFGLLKSAAKAARLAKRLGPKAFRALERLLKKVPPGCFTGETLVATPDGDRPIKSLRVGDRILTYMGGTSEEFGAFVRITATFFDSRNPHEIVELVLLRTWQWVIAMGAERAGAEIYLELHELGLFGVAKVSHVAMVPILGGKGRCVTSKLTRRSSDVYDVSFEEGGVPLRGTGLHPLYSVDRDEWVQIRHVQVGERLQTAEGAVTVEALEKVRGEHRVYNLEVEGDHEYLVGEARVRAHNACPNPAGRLGKQSTRNQNQAIAHELESRGWKVTGGGNRLPEEYLPGPGGMRKGSSFPDITATKNNRTLRVNTVDTLKDGVTPTAREARNAARIRSQTPGDHLLLVPKR